MESSEHFNLGKSAVMEQHFPAEQSNKQKKQKKKSFDGLLAFTIYIYFFLEDERREMESKENKGEKKGKSSGSFRKEYYDI